MHVEDRLPAVRAGVEHDAVAALREPLGDRHLHRGSQQLAGQARVGRGQGGDVRVVLLGDDHDVHRGLRGDVAEGEHARGVVDDGRRDVAGDDGAEQAVAHARDATARRG